MDFTAVGIMMVILANHPNWQVYPEEIAKRKGLRSGMKETINEFLKFRSQFTKREWIEINQVVEARLNEKADQLKLDDSDVEIISKRLEKVI